MRILLLLAPLLLAACDPFAAAQKADTKEAYEAFIADNPTSPWVLQAESRLEVLALEEARAQGSLEAYDAWLTRYPHGSSHDDVVAERETFLLDWARDQGTVEAYQGFLTEYPRSRRKSDVERHMRLLTYGDEIVFEDLAFSRVNLAEDPDGPLNGWRLDLNVHNVGEHVFPHVVLRVTAADTALRAEWPAAAAQWTMPLPDATRAPLQAGETRPWTYTTADLPETWSGPFVPALSDVHPMASGR